jgi:hypothetical protein
MVYGMEGLAWGFSIDFGNGRAFSDQLQSYFWVGLSWEGTSLPRLDIIFGPPRGLGRLSLSPKRVGATPAPSGSYVIEASLGLLEAAKLSLPRHWRGRCRHILSSKIPSKLPFKVHEKG